MTSIRAGSGLGDSIYLQSVVRHLVEKGDRVEACSDWPDVFLPLAGKVKVSPFRKDRVDRIAHYTTRKDIRETDQFQDCCLRAGITEPVDLRLDWTVVDKAAVRQVRASGKPVIVVQLPRSPMGRRDGMGRELLPDCRVIQMIIDRIGKRATFVQVGSGQALYKFSGIDIDLANRTTVAEMIDMVSVADACLGYVSFIVPLAESLMKPALLVWSRLGTVSNHPYIRTIRPRKILHRESSRAVMDDEPVGVIREAADALLEQVRDRAALRREIGGDRRIGPGVDPQPA